MKGKIILMIAGLLVLSNLGAQDFGKVIIRNASPSYPKFIISMNGIRLSNEYGNSITFDYLDEYNYRIKVLQAGSKNVLSFNVGSAPNYVSKYIINKDNYGNYSLILESKALMSGQEEPVTNTVVIPVETTTVVTKPTATVPVVTSTVPAGPQPMADNDYAEMLKVIKKENVESTKLEMAKTFMGDQHLSSAQVSGIMKAFSVESYRVNFAKFAYPRVVDKSNFFRVYDALSFSSSKRELSEFTKASK